MTAEGSVMTNKNRTNRNFKKYSEQIVQRQEILLSFESL